MTAPRQRLAGIAILLTTLLAGCLPGAADDPGVEVALVNAPAGERVPFLADDLQHSLVALDGCCRFDFIRSTPLRFQETHRDMFGSRAAPAAAAIARSLGAEVAVMVSAPRFERKVEQVDGGREVSGVVSLQATAIEAASGRPLGSVGSLAFRGRRFEPNRGSLPEIDEDPLMIALTRDAVADLAPHLAALLDDVSRDLEFAASGSSS